MSWAVCTFSWAGNVSRPRSDIVIIECILWLCRYDEAVTALEEAARIVSGALRRAPRASASTAAPSSGLADTADAGGARCCTAHAVQVFQNYATCLRKTEHYAEAEQWYRTAIALHPRHPTAIASLAFTLHLMQRSAVQYVCELIFL